MIPILLALTLQSAPAPATVPATVPLSQVLSGTPETLAPLVLPADLAGAVTGGSLRRAFIPGQVFSAGFWEQAAVHSEGVCARRAHWMSIGSPRTPGDAPADTPLPIGERHDGVQFAATGADPATAATCARAEGWVGSSDAQAEATVTMLRRLAGAVEAAKGRRPLPFSIDCVSEVPAACRAPRAALAALPMAQLLFIQLQNTDYREGPTENGVRVRYMQPVADGRWPQAEANFGASPPDGQSWTVLLKGVDRLEAVEMRRTTIIRH